MKINRDQFLEEGYLILRNVIPPARLEEVRAAHEIMVERQKVIWAQNRGPDDPPGGNWETGMQPRLILHDMGAQIDAQTASIVEIWLHENLHGVSSELLGLEDAGVTEMMMMCNPVRDRGPAAWHRDFSPSYCAPLQGYGDDISENGPRYVQWNVPLYDDDVLWVVPGSHIRFNSEEENQQLKKDNRAPLSSGVQTHLNAGDGVVYILPILHWGSNYSTKKRRTIHGGFSAFTHYPDLSYLEHLSNPAQDCFERWGKRSKEKRSQTEAVLRAAIKKDGMAYHLALDNLHPDRGPKGKLQSTLFLSKAARRIHHLKRPDFDDLPDLDRRYATSMHPMTLQWGTPMAERFTVEEAETLWARFKPVDDALQGENEQSAPGFQGGPSTYAFNDVPTDLNVDRFIAGWEA
jgi:ectoine hydroxylase-related dioxygenase (phytanoyl-CoA dioxygenase family)